jgi:hypothetical protein
VDQRSFFNSILRSVSNHYLHTNGNINGKDSAFDNRAIPGVAAMIAGLVKDNLYLEECLIEWLTTTKSDASTLPLGTRRAGMAVLAVDESKTSPSVTKIQTDILCCCNYEGHPRYCFAATKGSTSPFDPSKCEHILTTDTNVL